VIIQGVVRFGVVIFVEGNISVREVVFKVKEGV
jgi:hypothetical protein